MHIIETRMAPNPRRVSIFLAEKGIEVAREQRDLMTGELKARAFTDLNPWQRVPVLVLDDGTTISESIAICRYFEALTPEPALFGRTPVEIGLVEMWQRRVELGLFMSIAHVLRHLNPKMAPLEVPQVAAWGEANKAKVETELDRLNAHLAGSHYLAGEAFSVADITALVAVDFMKAARLRRPDGLGHLERWYAEVSARPSAAA